MSYVQPSQCMSILPMTTDRWINGWVERRTGGRAKTGTDGRTN